MKTISAKKPPSDRRCTRTSGKAFDARAEQTRSKRIDGGRENTWRDIDMTEFEKALIERLDAILAEMEAARREREASRYLIYKGKKFPREEITS